MRKWFDGVGSLLLAAIVVSALGRAVCGIAHAAPAEPSGGDGTPADCPWLDPHLATAKRVAMIMHKMTVADEIRIIGGQGEGVLPYVGNILGNPALCIPPLGLQDGPNGVGDGLTGVTQLPSGASLAATFSRKLAFEYGQVIGAEQAVKGSSVDLGPTVNIARDPRWGRGFESLSEDPTVSADLAVAEIRGIQSQGTIAQVKHLAAYNQETYRNTPEDDAIVSRRALQEIYFPAFRATIRQGKVGSIMCAYSTVNGEDSCASPYLLNDVLRDEWNFDGFVTSDWSGIHDLSAAKTGSDMEQPVSLFFGEPLRHAIAKGAIPRARLNTMVEPILYQMFRFGLFDHLRSASTHLVATTAAHQAISTAIAEAGTILLKNDASLLPLSPSASIAVIGPGASTQVAYGGGGSARVNPSSTVTPLAGIEAVAGGSRVTYTQGLPRAAQLKPIPAAVLSKPYTGTTCDTSYSATLRPPETGTYIIGFTNGCLGIVTLAIDGRALIDSAGPTTYLAAVQLEAGKAYELTLSAPLPVISPSYERTLMKLLNGQARKRLMAFVHWRGHARLAWATPSIVRADVQRAVKAAKSADVAVVVVVDDTETEGSDRPNLRLPSAQDALVSAVAKVNPHTVVVVQAGAPVAMPWLDQVPTILDTWYPGQTDGTALANVLFGRVDPSGHLPVTFPVKLADVPAASSARFPGIDGKVHYSEGLLVGYRWYDAKHIKPMFPFGFGLSYTHFRYSDLHVSRSEVNGVTPIEVSARVTNSGRVAGADVAQLYLGMPPSVGEPPRKLVGFQRVTLAPGESKMVHFTIMPRDEWWWDHGGWTETPGSYRVYVGDSSALADLPLTGRYDMKEAIGRRQVTVSAPKTFKLGVSTVVTVTLSAGGNEMLHDVHLSLKVPDGWSVVALERAHGDVTPNEVVTAKFEVTPPSWAVPQYVTLYGTADLGSVRRHGGETVLVVS